MILVKTSFGILKIDNKPRHPIFRRLPSELYKDAGKTFIAIFNSLLVLSATFCILLTLIAMTNSGICHQRSAPQNL